MLRMLKNFGWLAGSAALVLFSAGAEAGEVRCWPGNPIFPVFDSSCGDGRDCRAAIHQIDCCGSRRALGINYLEEDRFNEAEAVCEAQYPACECPDRGILADDGQSTYEAADVGAFCNEGSCATFVIPEG
jgi:hypothetical protein